MKIQKTNKKTTSALIAIVCMTVFVAILMAVSFNLFDGDTPVELLSLPAEGEKGKLVVYHIPSNATLQESIQLREVHSAAIFKTLANYERYQELTDFRRIDESTLRLVLKDTVSYHPRLDTFELKLNPD